MFDQVTLQSTVVLHYSLAMIDGTVIESSFEGDPLEVTMGSGQLTEGMELAIIGLKEGDSQTLTLTPEQCFGERDDANIHDMPLSEFPAELKPETGLTYNFGTPDGHEIPGTIRTVKDDVVEVDFNHPLAGHALIFSVEILDVTNPQAYVEDL